MPSAQFQHYLELQKRAKAFCSGSEKAAAVLAAMEAAVLRAVNSGGNSG